jgi:hypothetical protein
MTRKGLNFQARHELSQRKREEAKELKAARAQGLIIEPDALITKILLINSG